MFITLNTLFESCINALCRALKYQALEGVLDNQKKFPFADLMGALEPMRAIVSDTPWHALNRGHVGRGEGVDPGWSGTPFYKKILGYTMTSSSFSVVLISIPFHCSFLHQALPGASNGISKNLYAYRFICIIHSIQGIGIWLHDVRLQQIMISV